MNIYQLLIKFFKRVNFFNHFLAGYNRAKLSSKEYNNSLSPSIVLSGICMRPSFRSLIDDLPSDFLLKLLTFYCLLPDNQKRLLLELVRPPYRDLEIVIPFCTLKFLF